MREKTRHYTKSELSTYTYKNRNGNNLVLAAKQKYINGAYQKKSEFGLTPSPPCQCSVRERAFFLTLSCTLLHLVVKIFKKKNFKLIFHQQMHTSVKNKYFLTQVSSNCSVTLHWSKKKPICFQMHFMKNLPKLIFKEMWVPIKTSEHCYM